MGLYMDAPQAPDPKTTAATQTNSNVNTAVANTIMGNANTNTPTGSVKYTTTGTQKVSDGNGGFIDVPQYQRDETLSPQQQQLYDQQTQLGSSMNNLAIGQVDRLGNTLNQPLSTSGLPAQTTSVTPGQMQTGFNPGGQITTNAGQTADARTSLGLNTNAPTTFGNTAGQVNYGIDPTAGQIQYNVGPSDFSKDRTKVENAIYSRLDPQMDRDRAALESRLANQGVVQGSQAYNTAMDGLSRSATDARMQAILAGGQEQSRLTGLELQKGQFNNQAQAQDFGQNAQRTATNNSAQQQDYAQRQGRGMFAQAGTAQNNAALTTEGQFFNSGTQQNNDARLANASFANQAQAQQYGQNQDQANFYNSGTQQNFANNVTAGNFGNTARQNAFQELLAARNQPINEISSLMNGGQVTMPQFQAYQGGNVDSTPVGQYINQNYQTQANNAAQTNAGIFGALGSVAGAGLTAGFGRGGLFRS